MTPQKPGMKYLGPPVEDNGNVVKRELRLGKAESLKVMMEEYAFFTPAIMYMYGLFYDGPLIDFMYEQQQTIPIYYKKFRKPIFAGLETPNGDVDWNHALWVVKKEHFQPLSDFIVALTFTIREEKKIICFPEQDIEVVDPLFADNCVIWQQHMPKLPVRVFGVSTDSFRVAFVPQTHNLPLLQVYPPAPEMQTYANAAFAGINPIDARNAERYVKKVQEAIARRDQEGKTS